METVAFYSYKGGVGRSMLLAHAARFLARRGKGVVVLDFDFEAPGLHYKFGIERATAGGVVPYLIATLGGAASPPPFDDHMIAALVPAGAEGWVRLMPAGPAPHRSYWAALKELGDRLRLTDLSGRGFMALLDLQARIADELKPDYLLIDARTGVTELGGLATTVLADTVGCLLAPNNESVGGTLAVGQAMKASPRLANQKPLRIVPVLSRTPPGITRDAYYTSSIARLMAARGMIPEGSLPFVLPHDAELRTLEDLFGPSDSESPLYQAYVELFLELFPDASPASGT